MNLGKVFWKAATNLKVWKSFFVLFSFLLGVMMMATRGTPELAKGFVRGRDQGILIASSDQLIRASKSGQPVDLSGVQESIAQTRENVKKRSPSAPVLAYLEPISSALTKYQSAFARGDLDAAKTILSSDLAPASKILSEQLGDLNQKMDKEIETKAQSQDILWKLFIVFFFLGVLSLASLLTQWLNGDPDDWKLDFLDKRMNHPIMLAITNHFVEKHKLEDNKEEIDRLHYLQFLQFFTPDIESLSKGEDSLVEDRQDVTFELKAAEAFAYYTSQGKASFNLPPEGACNVKMRQATLAYALIHWMNEISTDQKLKNFNAVSEWDGKNWIVTLSTVGDVVHESIYNGYHQVMEKKAGLDNKNNDPLDFARTTFRKLCTEFKVTHDNGNLNLVMTFTPQ